LYDQAIAYLMQSDAFRELYKKLQNSPEKIMITFVSDMDDWFWTNSQYCGIDWDPTSGLLLGDGTSVQSAALGLVHEMGHAARHIDGKFESADEEQREIDTVTMYETPIAKQLGEPTRRFTKDYIRSYRMSNPTHFRTTSLQVTYVPSSHYTVEKTVPIVRNHNGIW